MPRLARQAIQTVDCAVGQGQRQSRAYCSRPAIIWPNYRANLQGLEQRESGLIMRTRTELRRTTTRDNENRQQPTANRQRQQLIGPRTAWAGRPPQQQQLEQLEQAPA